MRQSGERLSLAPQRLFGRLLVVGAIWILGSLSPLPSNAQTLAVRSGDRVRWKPMDQERVYGQIVRIDRDTLITIRTSQAETTLRFGEINHLEVRRASRGFSMGVNALAGGLIGGAIGAIAGQGQGRACVSTCSVSGPAVVAIAGASVGAAAGAVIGYFAPYRRWRSVRSQ
jgi:hypothetical protein